MIAIANRHRFNKATIRNATKNALRRAKQQEIDIWLQPDPEPIVSRKPNWSRVWELLREEATVLVPFVVFMWNDGLDYNEDGTSYQDDAPGDHAHSHHKTRKDAEIAVAYLENAGVNPNDLRISEDVLVPAWSLEHDPHWTSGVNVPDIRAY